MNDKLRLLTGFSLVLALGLAPACNGGKEDDTTDDGSSTSDDPSTSSDSMTSMPTTTTADTGDSSTTTTTATTDSTISTTDEPTTGPVCDMAELGAACADPECDCASGNCFVVGPLGGVCSECDEDADCADTTGFGCNFGNPLTMTPAVCSTTGDIGESCESADVCAAGLFCPTLIEVPGILSASTCSECESDGDCTGGQICTPTYDIANIGGFYQCVDPGSVPDNEGCNATGDGSECMSGNCAPAALMGIPVVAVCSPCNEDSDCMPGETCTLPEIAIAGNTLEVVPGMCG
ncbi:hypothetical protein [Paraliomyxa miuraensis]|uniref:hypothetical protein n=1 Tax=Paraliomyxa miuraensis TaxID=376150 RepID=UPI00225C09C9|nr:hypothetical protein [Paraliomyxa miuraensis]MCX4244780.1 hypothetical protein [Paraliomyxa miuraensis]